MSDDQERLLRAGQHLHDLARSMGWQDDGEGAIEFVMRRTREVGIEDARKDDLDQRLAAAGMISVDELLSGQPIDKWRVHTGVEDLESFGKYLEMKRREYSRMAALYELGDKPKDDELYEWVFGHYGAFTDIHVNFRAAMERMNETRHPD